ncbi:hypothetical protein [Planctomonas deserti]|uniref:hypothetical protein n=1 Tax=Planctomonas deserti TaxID=2144185 RepID=UPI000D3C6A28|nr:hypothetical protein [Planctomonas deserti]
MSHRTALPPLLAAATALLLAGCAPFFPDPFETETPSPSASPPPSATASPDPTAPPSPSATPSPSVTPSPTPSDEPSPDPSSAPKPDLDDIFLTTEGLGSLRIGRPAAASGMVEYDPDHCDDVAEDPADPANGRWVSTYGSDTFGVSVTAEGVVLSIGVRQADLRTPRDIGVGSTVDELRAAHPEVTQVPLAEGLTDVWVLRGPSGQTVFEVANDTSPGYFPPEEVGTVVTLRTSELGYGERSIWGSDGGEGSCL